MNVEVFLRKFIPVFILATSVDFVVSHLFSIIFFQDFYFNWYGPLHTGITLGIILAILNYKTNSDKKNPAQKDGND